MLRCDRALRSLFGTTFNPYYASSLNLSISQPLLRNAGQWANTHSIRLAAYNRQIIGARTKLYVIMVLAAVDRVYWRLYAARRELEVREQQYDLAQVQLEQAQRLVDAGQRAQVEVIRAEAGVALQLEAIIVAENNLRDRERDLKRVFPPDRWGRVHLQMIYFGREYCPARGHDLRGCPICSWAATKKRIERESRGLV